MTGTRWRTDRLIDDVAVLARRGLPRERYFAEVAARLRRVFDCDAACWHTLDPQTRLITSEAPEELISAGVFTSANVAEAGALVVASEYLIPDFNTFAGLARRRVPVGILSHATNGHPERSTRYSGLRAAGIPHEMRAAFVSRGRAWGAVHLARREDCRDFTAQDAAALASVSGLIADGIRSSLRLDAARAPQDAAAPGLVVLGPSDEVELITPPARELLAAMSTWDATAAETPPSSLLALAAVARSEKKGSAPGDADAVAVPTAAGWVTMHASLPEGSTSRRVAIVLERTATRQSTAVRLEADGVTAREREIATLLAQGLTNAEIADTLVLSPYTVQDHIKSLFEKTGVSSRQELVARIFLDDYTPQLARHAPLRANGSFVARQR